MNDTPTIGEIMQRSRRDGLRAISIALAGIMIAAGLAYTGIHNYNLFRKALPADQAVFALIPVILLEGSIALFLVASFVWFSVGPQKTLATAFSWILFAIVGFNTLIDSTINTGNQIPSWLEIYATLMLPVTPVLVVAMWKIIIDSDPTKRQLDMQRTIEAARIEAQYQAAQRALTGEATRQALADYATLYESALAARIRASAPGSGSPPPKINPKAARPASPAMNGVGPAQAGPSGA